MAMTIEEFRLRHSILGTPLDRETLQSYVSQGILRVSYPDGDPLVVFSAVQERASELGGPRTIETQNHFDVLPMACVLVEHFRLGDAAPPLIYVTQDACDYLLSARQSV